MTVGELKSKLKLLDENLTVILYDDMDGVDSFAENIEIKTLENYPYIRRDSVFEVHNLKKAVVITGLAY